MRSTTFGARTILAVLLAPVPLNSELDDARIDTRKLDLLRINPYYSLRAPSAVVITRRFYFRPNRAN